MVFMLLTAMVIEAKAQSDWPPEVTIRYLNSSGQEKEGFKFAPEENAVGTHNFTFTVE